MDYTVWLIMLWIMFAFVGAAVGAGKGRGVAGFFLGLALGLIGVIIMAVMPDTAEKAEEKRRAMASTIASAIHGTGGAGSSTGALAAPVGGLRGPSTPRVKSDTPVMLTCDACGREWNAARLARCPCHNRTVQPSQQLLAPQIAEVPRAAEAATPSLASELARLVDMHNDGHLSDEEFTAAKTAILGKVDP